MNKIHLTLDDNVGILYNKANKIRSRMDANFMFSNNININDLPTFGVFYKIGISTYLPMYTPISDVSAGITCFYNRFHFHSRYHYIFFKNNYYIEPQLSWHMPKISSYITFGYNLFLNNGECSNELGGFTITYSYLIQLLPSERPNYKKKHNNERYQKRKKNNQ